MTGSPKDLADRPEASDDAEAPVDVLAELLDSLHPTTLIFGRLELGAPWALQYPHEESTASLYVVGRGTAELTLEGHAPVRLSAGDVALVTQGGAHRLRDGEGAVAHVLEEGSCRRSSAAAVRLGGDGLQTTLVGGAFRFAAPRRSFLLRSLPPLLHIEAADPRTSSWLASTVHLLLAETVARSPGGTVVVSRLVDVLLIHTIRTHIESGSCPEHGLRALTDPQIGRALQMVHARPAAPWTVEGLARAVGASRSAFAARFTALVGDTPLEYVARWRMTRAAALLRGSQLSLVEVAERVGYQSEAAFSRAFKQREGTAPATYRRQVSV